MPASPSIYGHRLRQARKARRWTQPELGRCLGVDHATAAVRISRYESGQHSPDATTAALLAKALGLPPAWFHADTDAMAEAIALLSRLPKGKQVEAVAILKAAMA